MQGHPCVAQHSLHTAALLVDQLTTLIRRPWGSNPGPSIWITMTTATPLGDTPIFSLNMTTRGEDFLYKSSGAIIAAIVVVVIIIFSVVLILLKMYNRKMRTRRELEPKGHKPASPSALGPNGNSNQQPATVTFIPVDVHAENR
ncbi:noncompact myelin-associated protein isoform X3 [Dasypus novemcinctus]|uniref:noncompact myelin-associated protein isoform X3 n=1 Tax=Dasypus novemcinctus TaxID=9361 RepID=UPI0039C946FD